MKKAIIIILIAIVAVSSAFAFKFNSVGIETGRGFYASVDMEIVGNLDAYARFGYTGYIDLSFGAQYKVAELKVSHTALPVKPGAQMGFDFGDGYFMFTLLGTCSFSFDVDCFTAFIRPGLGFAASRYTYYSSSYEGGKKTYTSTDFAFLIETGVAYLF